MIEKILDHFNLKSEREDYATIHENIEKDIVFRGTNLWILIFAIFIASVGLNVNSTAVIIGAMLVSPLMGPIIGMGYGAATYDFHLLRRAAYNFTFAVVTSLITSTIYFSITPLYEAHSELLARTSPSFYDVLIALFGGLAGIVAMTSKRKGNVIPGVAIATALMPPLCTAGYGLATLNGEFFFGAMYLFTINTVFIGIATLMTTRFLRFPIREQVDERHKILANRWATGIVILTVLPSIFFGYRLIKKDEFLRNAERFVRSVTIVEGAYLLKNEVDPAKRAITLIYGGRTLGDDTKRQIAERANDFALTDVALNFQQGFTVGDVGKELTQAESFKAEINRLKLLLHEAQAREDSIRQQTALGRILQPEMRALFPEIVSLAVSKSTFFGEKSEADSFDADLVIIRSANPGRTNAERKRIEEWLHARLGSSSLKVFIERAER
jgi:uncharacterized hydrophobic protein (TIGR00271 family)